MKRRNLSNKYFPHINGLIKQLKIFLQSVAKKQDVFRIFTDWPRQEFDLPDAKNFKCSAVVIVRLLVLIMKDKVEELSNTDIKTFAISTGDEEVIDEGVTTDGDCTVGESFGFCCPGVEPEFFAELTNKLCAFVSTDSPNEYYFKCYCIDRYS